MEPDKDIQKEIDEGKIRITYEQPEGEHVACDECQACITCGYCECTNEAQR